MKLPIPRLLKKHGSVRVKTPRNQLFQLGVANNLHFSEFFLALYSEVGNGGVGPGDGTCRIEEIVAEVVKNRSEPDENWPSELVTLLDFGGGLLALVDLSHEFNQVFYYDIANDDHPKKLHNSLEMLFVRWLDAPVLVGGKTVAEIQSRQKRAEQIVAPNR